MTRRIPRLAALIAAVLVLTQAALAHAASSAGSTDSRYGHDGQVTFDVPGYEYPRAMAVFPNGSVAIALDTDRELVVVKATPSGAPDASFGGNGTVRPIPAKLASAPAMFVTRDGGLLIVAWVAKDFGGVVTKPRLVLVRLRPDGTRDPKFGQGRGLIFVAQDVVRPLADAVLAAAMTRDGDVVVAGLRGVSFGYYGHPGATGLVKFAPSGHVDRTFGIGGFVPVDAAVIAPGTFDVARDSRDRVLVATTDSTLGPTVETLRVLRFTPDGRPDVTFGTGGVTPFTMGGDWNFITDLVVDQRDRVVVAGFVADGIIGSIRNALTQPAEPDLGFTPTIVRLTARGRLDQGFGGDGMVSVHRDRHGRELVWSDALAIDSAGRPLFNAVARDELTLIRLTDAGTVDAGFEQPTLPFDSWIRLAVHGDRIFASGYREEGDSAKQYRTILAAYLS